MYIYEIATERKYCGISKKIMNSSNVSDGELYRFNLEIWWFFNGNWS